MDEVAAAVKEGGNVRDHCTVTILEGDTYCCVGHLPHQIQCHYFLKMG